MVADISTFLYGRLKKIPRQVWYAIIAALIIGFVTHIAFWASGIINHDSVNYLVHSGDLTTQGKWFSGAMTSGMRGNVPANNITAPLGIIFLALTAGFTVSALSIHKPLYAVIVAGFIVTFPSVCSSFLYHAGDYFAVSLLLAAMAAFFTVKFKWGFWVGITLLTLSLGSYMAYVGYAAGLMLTVCIVDCISNKEQTKKIIFKALKYVVVLIAACLIYYAILRICLHVQGLALSSYRGIDQMGNFSLAAMPGIVKQTFVKVLNFFAFDQFGIGSQFFKWLYRIVILMDFLMVALSIWKSKAYKKPAIIVLSVLFVLLFPFAIHLIGILGMNANTHWIMILPFVVLFIVMIKLMENFQMLCEKAPKDHKAVKSINIARIINWIGVGVSTVLIFQWAVLTNQIYYRMNINYENSYAAAVNIMIDIRDVPGYTTEVPVLISMDEPLEMKIANEESFARLRGFTGVNMSYLFAGGTSLVKSMLGAYVGFGYVLPTEEQSEAIKNSQAYLDMPVYPNDGSVEMIDGVIVVKLS